MPWDLHRKSIIANLEGMWETTVLVYRDTMRVVVIRFSNYSSGMVFRCCIFG